MPRMLKGLISLSLYLPLPLPLILSLSLQLQRRRNCWLRLASWRLPGGGGTVQGLKPNTFKGVVCGLAFSGVDTTISGDHGT